MRDIMRQRNAHLLYGFALSHRALSLQHGEITSSGGMGKIDGSISS